MLLCNTHAGHKVLITCSLPLASTPLARAMYYHYAECVHDNRISPVDGKGREGSFGCRDQCHWLCTSVALPSRIELGLINRVIIQNGSGIFGMRS